MGKKLKEMLYGLGNILKIVENAFQLDLPQYMEIYSIINVENLKLLEPSMLDEKLDQEPVLLAMDDRWVAQERLLGEDCIVEKIIETRCGRIESCGLARRVSNLAKPSGSATR